ncbi:Probable phosphotransferase enzyme IIB component M6_Spy0801 [uncultured Clostridium sp.]|uniref:PTS sugar transporter subunit IIB n=1 Tax=uncultured Clostridium sp. TaxID=59620 RepID=UPI0008204C67|nr:PTS sugar transporter subunit IIB [uncultured Clostridium sp.]SCJ06770.1 Probable phosphotransferase enzyme IIB component M6_Spy0801 [uncultured Clostridium sp.]
MKIFRVDSRLVHGQTVNYWCDKYNISKIIVVNDELSKDSFSQLFYKLSISNEFQVEFISITDSIDYKYIEENNYLIIFKGLKDVLKYLEEEGVMDEIIISNTDSAENKWEIISGVFISNEDEKNINFIKNKFDVNVIYKAIY